MLGVSSLRKAFFSAGAKKGVKESANIKTVNPITKLAHVKLDLAKMLQAKNMPLIRQNTKNRKADVYANPDRVLQLYNDHKIIRHELDQLRKRRNDHAAITKQIVTMEDDNKREEMMKQHVKVGKTYKKQVQDREKTLDTVEDELV